MIIFRKSIEIARDSEGQYENGMEMNKVAKNARSNNICLFPKTIFLVVIYLRIMASRVNPPTILANGITSSTGNMSAGLRKLRITNAVSPTIGLTRQVIETIIAKIRAITRTVSR